MARLPYRMGVRLTSQETQNTRESNMLDGIGRFCQNHITQNTEVALIPEYLNQICTPKDTPALWNPAQMLDHSPRGIGVRFWSVDSGDGCIPLGGPMAYCFKTGDLVFTSGKMGGRFIVLFNLADAVAQVLPNDVELYDLWDKDPIYKQYLDPIISNPSLMNAVVFETLVALKGGKDLSKDHMVHGQTADPALNQVEAVDFPMIKGLMNQRIKGTPPFFQIWHKHLNETLLTPTLLKRIQDNLARMMSDVAEGQVTPEQEHVMGHMIVAVARALISIGAVGPLQGKMMFGTLGYKDKIGYRWCMYDLLNQLIYILTLGSAPGMFRSREGGLNDLHPAYNFFLLPDNASFEEARKNYRIGDVQGDSALTPIFQALAGEFANLPLANNIRKMMRLNLMVNRNGGWNIPQFPSALVVQDPVFECINKTWRTRNYSPVMSPYSLGNDSNNALARLLSMEDVKLEFTEDERKTLLAVWTENESEYEDYLIGRPGMMERSFIRSLPLDDSEFAEGIGSNYMAAGSLREAITATSLGDYALTMKDESLYLEHGPNALTFSAVVGSVKMLTVNEADPGVLWEGGFTGTGEGGDHTLVPQVAAMMDPTKQHTADIVINDRINNTQATVKMSGISTVLNMAQKVMSGVASGNTETRIEEIGYLFAPLPLVSALVKAVVDIAVNLK